jgi:hypothetical protein
VLAVLAALAGLAVLAALAVSVAAAGLAVLGVRAALAISPAVAGTEVGTEAIGGPVTDWRPGRSQVQQLAAIMAAMGTTTATMVRTTAIRTTMLVRTPPLTARSASSLTTQPQEPISATMAFAILARKGRAAVSRIKSRFA